MIILLITFLGVIFTERKQEYVSAAVFDAPLLPGGANYNLGSAIQRWQNGFFSGNLTAGNLSIGTTTIADRLYVTDGNITQELKSEIGISTINKFNIGDRSRAVYISGKYAYLLTDYITNALKIIDISNPNSPKIVGSLSLPNGGAEIYVSGKYAYVSSLSGYLTIIDISTVSSPRIINSISTPASSEIFVSGLYAYLINPYSDKFFIMNIANPTNPFLISSSTLGGSINRSLYVFGRYAYVSGYFSTTASLGIIDISNPISPKVLTNYSINLGAGNEGSNGGLYVSGRYAYMPVSNNTLWPNNHLFTVLNIADPANPQIYATTTINMNDAVALTGAGQYIYVVNDSPSDGKISIINVSDPKNPKQITIYPAGYRPGNIKISGKYTYITNWDAFNPNTFTILDISGLETVSANIHSLEAGNLQVRNNIIAQGQLQVSGGINVGTGGIFSAGPIGISIASTTQTDAISAYFQGRVGIATTTPTQKLEVNGGIRLYGNSESTCDATGGPSTRGTLRFTPGASLVADTLEICNSSSTAPGGYVWRKLY